ncbi:MAG: type II secretion system minor pseudopilin GspJ [Sphingomonas sp.]
MMRRHATAGFTLVEMMISLLIFALLAAAGVGLLAFSVRAQGATDDRLGDIAQLNQLGSALAADLAQAQNRPTRDESGNRLPPFTGASGSDQAPMLRLVRAGWTNVDSDPRPSEQKVEYRLDNGVLERVAYPMVDGTRSGPAAAIVSGVERVALRYRFGGAWSDRWDSTPQHPLPDALELTLARAHGATYRELFLVGTGYRPHVAPGGGNAG